MQTTVTKEISGLLGGPGFTGLESLSLRLQKFTVIGERSNRTQLDLLCRTHKKISPPEIKKPDSVSFEMKLMGRLMVNQAEGLFENAGLCIHRHYNCPYIPGSALKGIARHAAWWDWSELTDENEKRKQAESIAFTFGYPTGEQELDEYIKELDLPFIGKSGEAFSGSVSFLPAFPCDNQWSLAVDILNSHKDDCSNPIPIFFPAVEKGAIFKFCISPVKNKAFREGTQSLVFAENCLKKALLEDGIGAKTAAGYGWFEEVRT
jgi:CRISPR type III-B/RAMP module RAMP protein Cmr6